MAKVIIDGVNAEIAKTWGVKEVSRTALTSIIKEYKKPLTTNSPTSRLNGKSEQATDNIDDTKIKNDTLYQSFSKLLRSKELYYTWLVRQNSPTKQSPYVAIFDGNINDPSPNPSDLTDWTGGLLTSIDAVKSDCAPLEFAPAHTEAVASILSLGAYPAANPPKTITQDQFDLSGSFLKFHELSDPPPIREEEARGEIMLTVFTGTYPPDAKDKIDLILDDLEKNQKIMVVSAPERQKIGADSNTIELDFGQSAYVLDRNYIVDYCNKLKIWPACLGIHPRVLVVAPSDAELSDGSSVFDLVFPAGPAEPPRSRYFLGSSRTRISAPGRNIPVIFRSENQPDGLKWLSANCSGSSFSAPFVVALIARVYQELQAVNGHNGSSKNDPYWAMNRVQSTVADLIKKPGIDEREPASMVRFGELDVERALYGIDAEDIGPNSRSALYFRDGTARRLGVVSGYPWLRLSKDNPEFAQRLSRPSYRGVLPYYLDDNKPQAPIEIQYLQRIHFRKLDTKGVPTFDIFYYESAQGGSAPTFRTLVKKSGVHLGYPAGLKTPSYHCDLTGVETRDMFPACLYVWDDKVAISSGFIPIDLTSISDIIFPPFHHAAFMLSVNDATNIRSKIDFGNLASASARYSPWRSRLCDTVGIPTATIEAWIKSPPLPQSKKLPVGVNTVKRFSDALSNFCNL
jgi:hypothetical protein